MTASPAKTLATKRDAIEEIVERIALTAIEDDRALHRDCKKLIKKSPRKKPSDLDFVAGATLGAMAAARAWLKASKLTAVAYGMTGQTDPQLVHGDESVTLRTPKRRRAL